MDDDRFDELVSAAALPFVVGMALGIAVGRLLDGLLLGIALGLVFFVVFVWIRLRLASLPR